MKTLKNEEIVLFFAKEGCELLDEYKKCNLSMTYRCRCGAMGRISLDKFKRRLKRSEGCWNCNRKEWTMAEDELLKNLYGKFSRQEIHDQIPGTTLSSIKSRAATLGLVGNRSLVQRRARKGKGRKYQINFDYFDMIDVQRSYWGGFIAADGCVSEKRKTLAIRLHEKDRLHLECFRDMVGYTGKIYDVSAVCRKGRFKSGPQVLIQFCGVDNWLKKLENTYNIVPRKSLILEPPINLDENNSLAYIIGYTDGDGCISTGGRITTGKRPGDWSIQYIGTFSVLCWIKTWFDRWCPAVRRRHASVRLDKKGHYRYSVAGQRAKYLLKKMMDIEVPRLSRKWHFDVHHLGETQCLGATTIMP